MSTTIVVLLVLALWRFARLLSIDEISRPLRERIAGRKPDGQVAYLVTCPWCISIWCGWLLVVPTVLLATDLGFWIDGLWLSLLLVLAGSLVAGFGTTVEDRLDR